MSSLTLVLLRLPWLECNKIQNRPSLSQMILGVIPFLVPQLYAFSKVKQTKKGAILLGIIYGLPPIVSMILSVINWFNMNLVNGHFSVDAMGILNSIMGFFYLYHISTTIICCINCLRIGSSLFCAKMDYRMQPKIIYTTNRKLTRKILIHKPRIG